jgi:hypothetical protein
MQPTTASKPSPAVIVPVAPDPIAKGIPHGSQIIEVAVTDAGDAAITFDAVLGVRLWPALDGTRPPIPLIVEAPRHVSIAHEGRDLLAVIISDAGSVRVMQLGHDGRVRSNVTLPAQYQQAIAIDGGVLVRTADHAIERYAIDGTLRGRVVADPGKQIVTLVARNGHSAALIANAELGTAREVRRVMIDDGISWGQSVELASAVQGEQIAMSPNGRRIAYGSLQHKLEVWEVEPFKRAITGSTMPLDETARGIGFLDESHVAVHTNSTPMVQLWTEFEKPTPKQLEPWAVGSEMSPSLPLPKEQSRLGDGFAVADGKVVSGYGGALAVSSLEKVQYLGYKALALGMLTPVDDQVAMSLNTSRLVWLDDKLVIHRDEDLKPATSSWLYAIPLDRSHVVTQTNFEGRYEFSLVDLATKATVSIGKYSDVDRMQYDHASHLFGIKEGKKLHRFTFDAATNTMSPLPDLRIKGSTANYMLFDPAKANGMLAAVVGWDSDEANYETLTVYRQDGKPTRYHPFMGTLTSSNVDGTLYATDAGVVRVYRNGAKKPTTIKLPSSVLSAVTSDGSRIAYTTHDELIVADATGAPIWRQPQWGTNQLTFSTDGKSLLLHGVGGVASYDVATGTRTARECGWNFGLYDEALDGGAPGAAPMCEDPMLQ